MSVPKFPARSSVATTPDSSPDPESVRAAQEIALRALDRRRRTRRELERRLAEKGLGADIVREALDRLERVGLVDDLEYARAFLRERLSRRAVGERALKSQLFGRGVPAAVVDQALEELRTGGGEAAGAESSGLPRSETERALRALRQVERRYRNLEPRARRQRLAAALARRGFDYEAVGEALARFEQEGAE